MDDCGWGEAEDFFLKKGILKIVQRDRKEKMRGRRGGEAVLIITRLLLRSCTVV